MKVQVTPWRACVAGIWVWLFTVTGYAKVLTYSASIENSQWYQAASIFECSVTHSIPNFGKAVFYHEAGEKLKFFLETNQSPMAEGRAALVVEAPDWAPGRQVQDLGLVDVLRTRRPVAVGEVVSTNMMAGLMDGMMPTFTRKAWYSEDRIRVRVNPVNFSQFYNDYQSCVATLLPVNFRQVERTVVQFEADKAALNKEDKKALDKVVLYVQADKTVSAIFVDGHTDSSGRRITNRRLSRDRADAVTSYLVKMGLAPELVTTRYHGERYPVVSNKTKSNRERNRRATVRLQRGERAPIEDETAPAE